MNKAQLQQHLEKICKGIPLDEAREFCEAYFKGLKEKEESDNPTDRHNHQIHNRENGEAMIPKIICWLFGHILRQKEFTGEMWDTVNQATGLPIKGKFYVWHYLDRCPRCGKTIKKMEGI